MCNGYYSEHPKEDTDGENKQVGPHQSLIKQTIAFFLISKTYILALKNIILILRLA